MPRPEGGEQKARINPQLQQAFRIVVTKVEEQVISQLERMGLIDGEGNPLGDLTEEGLDLLSQGLVGGIRIAFSRAKLNIPIGHSVDQEGLGDSITKGFGKPCIRRKGNNLVIGFSGKEPLVRRIVTPLDIDEALGRRGPDKKVAHN